MCPPSTWTIHSRLSHSVTMCVRRQAPRFLNGPFGALSISSLRVMLFSVRSLGVSDVSLPPPTNVLNDGRYRYVAVGDVGTTAMRQYRLLSLPADLYGSMAQA